MVLVDETPPRCGGFTLWPRSHLRLHPHWDTVHGGQMASARGEGFRLARDDVLRDITPVEFAGSAGDVVFWHPRMLHSAGVNYSAETTPLVRMVVPCDYQRAGLSYFDDDQYGARREYQWWVDTRNFKKTCPRQPTTYGTDGRSKRPPLAARDANRPPSLPRPCFGVGCFTVSTKPYFTASSGFIQ